MIPQVFLSLSGKDDEFVERTWRHLPQGLARFYRKTFENGQQLLEAMEVGVDECSVFVFFASPASIASPWVKFELDRARLDKIRRPTLRVLVFPLSPDVVATSLPAWLQQAWVANAGFGPRDIARYVTQIITSKPIAPPALSVPVMGRGQLLDITSQRLMSTVGDTKVTPNIFIFAGVNGIGRRTFARHFVEQVLPALPNLRFGPELLLPQYADLADLYRALREQIEPAFSLESYERSLGMFRKLSVDEQIAEVANSICYFAHLGQAVFVTTGSGLVEDRGDTKPWLRPLFAALATRPDAMLLLVSNRQIREEQLRPHPNVLQFTVPPLKDADVRALMTAVSTVSHIAPLAPGTELVRSIGGHPDLAKAAVRLVAQKGLRALEQNPAELFSIQDEILSANLDVDALTDVQSEVLCLLSWVPQLGGHILERVIGARHKAPNAFGDAVEELVLGCLVIVAGTTFAISSAIREMFRRKYGFGPDGLLQQFSSALSAEWAESIGAEFRADLFDAFVFMHALEGRSLPDKLANLLLPSTLQEVIREAYARGHDDVDALRRVITWGDIAHRMDMDAAVREEILSTVVRAHVRLEQYKQADDLLKEFDANGYRSAPFLRGFSLRRQEKHRDALPHFRKALENHKRDRSAVQELAMCFKRLGMWNDLKELIEEHKDIIEGNAHLLDFYVGTLIANARIREAESAIRRLSVLPQDDGRSAIRRAQIMIQRDHDYAKAEEVLTKLLASGVGSKVDVHRWRAIAAAYAKHFAQAKQDIEFVRSRPGRRGTAERLHIHLLLAQGEHEEAERCLAALGAGRSTDNDSLRARILETRAADVRLALPERDQARKAAEELRARLRDATDFDVE